MKVSDSIPKIYVLGPSSSGKSSFIHTYFGKQILELEGLIVESSEMIMPNTFSKIFLILPEKEELAKRQNQENCDEDYYKWLDFFSKNKSSIEIKRVK